MRISRLYLFALMFALIGILVWFGQYWQGYEFRTSDLFDDRIHHEKIMVAAFIIAASISVWGSLSHRRPFTHRFIKLTYKVDTYLDEIGTGRIISYLGQFNRLIINTLMRDLCIKIDNMTLYIYPDYASYQDYILKPYEPYTIDLFKKVIKPGIKILDIGAQFGYYSLIAAKLVGPEGRIFAFEPVPSNLMILKRNIEVNDAKVIIPIQKAVGDKTKKVDIYIYKKSSSHGMFPHPNAAIKDIISAECIAIDEFLHEESVDVIKMDIEGSEPYALSGMRKIISLSKRLVLFTELNPYFLRRAGVEPGKYIEMLQSYGFNVQFIDESSHRLKPITEDLLISEDPSWYVNLYCTKG